MQTVLCQLSPFSTTGLILNSKRETDRKRVLRFRPKTKTKLSCSSDNTRQSSVLAYYVNAQMMQHKYKIITNILNT